MELESLKSLIRQAFADTPYPGDDNIAGCSRIGCDDCEPLAAHFKGTTWQQHSLQTLAGFDGLSFFHTEARHYYFPAYMLADLENRRLFDLYYSESEDYEGYVDPLPNLDLCWPVSPHDEESIQEEHGDFVRLLSSAQRRAVVEYLKYIGTDEEGYEPGEDTLKAIDFLENAGE